MASFLITAVGAILLADDVRRVLSVDSQVNLFTWVALALMACAVIATGVMLKRAAERVRLLMAWGVGVSPLMYGIVAAQTGSPVVVMWLGVLLAVGLVGWVLIAGPPPASRELPDHGR